MSTSPQQGKKAAKLLAVGSVLWVLVLGNAQGVFASFYTFFRTISLDNTPLAQYGYGYGFDETETYGYGYGYGVDKNPTAFSFTALVNKDLTTVYESNDITVSGINRPVTVSITGGEYFIDNRDAFNGGSFFVETASAMPSNQWTSATGTVRSGDIIRVRLTSSNAYGTAKSATLTVGEGSAAFTVTTKSQAGGGGGGSGGSSGGSSGSSSSSSSQSSSGTTSTTKPSNEDTPVAKCGAELQKKTIAIRVNDVSSASKAWTSVKKLVRYGIVDNVPKFRPNDRISRGEFIKMVVVAAGCNVPSGKVDSRFKDVEGSAFAPYIQFALNEHLISDNFTLFRPNAKITRKEAEEIIYNLQQRKLIKWNVDWLTLKKEIRNDLTMNGMRREGMARLVVKLFQLK